MGGEALRVGEEGGRGIGFAAGLHHQAGGCAEDQDEGGRDAQ